MYLVSEVAEKLGVSKTAVYNKLKQDPFKSKVQVENNVTLIDDDLLNLIQDSLKPKSKDDSSASINMDAHYLKLLQEQVTIKDNQIRELIDQLKEKDIQIAKIQELHDQTQQLFGKQLQQQEVKLIEPPKEKKSWLKKLFG